MHNRPLEINDKSDSKLIHQTCTLFGLDLEVAKLKTTVIH